MGSRSIHTKSIISSSRVTIALTIALLPNPALRDGQTQLQKWWFLPLAHPSCSNPPDSIGQPLDAKV